jgi:hypothetical protein
VIEQPSPADGGTGESSANEPTLLQPFTPVENYPNPPTDQPTPGAVEAVPPMPDSATGAVPLFEGRVELNGIETAPAAPQTAFPPAPTPLVPMEQQPTAPSPAVLDAPLPAEDPEEISVNSTFPLRFAPRLFRVREHAAHESVHTAPPVTETSAQQGARILSGHSVSAPGPVVAPPQSGSSGFRSGHSY